jgi:hypothetical protein
MSTCLAKLGKPLKMAIVAPAAGYDSFGNTANGVSRACLEDPVADNFSPEAAENGSAALTIGELPANSFNCLAVRVACRAMSTYCVKYSERVNKKLALVVVLILTTFLGGLTGHKTFGYPFGTVSGALAGVCLGSVVVCLFTYGDVCFRRCGITFCASR